MGAGDAGVSVVILTFNEEANLADCLKSVAWSDDTVVFDSYSTDRTEEIAAGAGARIFKRRFDDFAAQRNAALTDVPFHHPWVLMLDADERVTPELGDEIVAAVRSAGPETVLFHVRRKDMFLGRWLRRSSGYPTWFGRVIRLGHVKVLRPVNEQYVADGAAGNLRGHLVHFPFGKGIAWWVEKHNRYSSMEAALLCDPAAFHPPLRDLGSRDPVRRRRALKALAYRLPGRPLLVFGYLYVLRGGWLDGRAGFVYCCLRGFYEFLIDVKVRASLTEREGAECRFW